MKHLKLFEELRPDYYGYLSGTLPYLTKHKNEILKEIEELEKGIKSQEFMSNWGRKFGRLPSLNMREILTSRKNQLKLLKDELKQIDDEISKFTKSKLEESLTKKQK